ncbi:MAG: bifunctional (p)ppGpp synthetase/guanosine-3',5'-bis(diphosphate) 3'-pyrophosphohydrolase [Desulfamplus sp.]|nr:bifunctional (p)ppGpp synthetase/guanosine-3',5'-bis(diphosphate) 3'-pyrophosphohydrolase [Desulfamplus sp.]
MIATERDNIVAPKEFSYQQPPFIRKLNEILHLEDYPCLINLCCRNNRDGSKNIILEALEFAYEHHAGQIRKSGELYINHPIAVAEIIAGTMGLNDPELIAATLLHDIVEDVSSLTTGIIEKRFGKNVARFVDGCTKMKMRSLDKSLNKDMTYKKLISMASENPEILLIKIADRVHNMHTINFLNVHKRQRIAHETMEIYAPLAEKLGLFSIKRTLFEMALRHLFPKKSKKLLNILKTVGASDDVAEIKSQLAMECRMFQFNIRVTSRLKNLYAFYSSRKKTLDINRAENLVDFTIILDTMGELNCYHVLGIINTLFSPVPKSIRDYIANPKTNGYKSIHVRITYKDRRYLVKIRTADMERIARRGVLLHWDNRDHSHKYKKVLNDILKDIADYEGSPVTRKDMIRQLIEDDKVFVYTPNGSLHYLPEGSIVLDFAYKIHTTLGDHCRYAMVNSSRVSPSHLLRDGDKVEIITSSSPSEISSDIEVRCRTPKARSAINKKIQKKRDNYAGKIGRDIMHQAIDRYGFGNEIFDSGSLYDFLAYQGLDTLEDFFVSIGQFRFVPLEVLWEIDTKDSGSRIEKVLAAGKSQLFSLMLTELQRDVHKFSQCCTPLPGVESCLGLLSVNGISLHRIHCEKYKSRRGYSDDKRVHITWDMKKIWREPVVFNIIFRGISFNDLIGIIADIISVVNITTIDSSSREGAIALKVELQSFDQTRIFFSAFESRGCHVEIEDFYLN